MVDQDPGSDILRAVSDLGGTIDSIEEITRLRGAGKLNACFRVGVGAQFLRAKAQLVPASTRKHLRQACRNKLQV